MTTKRVAFCARVSIEFQTTDNQLTELRAAAARMGWTVVTEYVDHGISGAKGRDKRPELNRLLHGVARREFDIVAAWSNWNFINPQNGPAAAARSTPSASLLCKDDVGGLS